MSSSADLHPVTGARFVFDRVTEAPLVYRVGVYLPEGRASHCTLGWTEAGALDLQPTPTEKVVVDELVKLARVLRREAKSRVIRWRDI